MLLLEDQVPDTSLLVNFIYKSMELLEELFLLDFEILELLESDLVLPFDLLGGTIVLSNALGSLGQLLHYDVVFSLLFEQSRDIIIRLLKWLDDLAIGLLLVHFLFLLV